MKYLILILSLVSAPVAFADMTGKWVVHGGQITDASGNKQACSDIEITLTQTADMIVLEHYYANCPGAESDWGPNHMPIKDGKAYNNDGDEIGTYANNTLQTSEPEDGILYIFNLQLVDGAKPVLKSTYGVQNFIGSMSIDGDLEKAD